MAADLTRQLQGREIAEVCTNGHILSIRTKCGAEILIKWVDLNGNTLKGEPLIHTRGFRMNCRDFKNIILGSSAGVT